MIKFERIDWRDWLVELHYKESKDLYTKNNIDISELNKEKIIEFYTGAAKYRIGDVLYEMVDICILNKNMILSILCGNLSELMSIMSVVHNINAEDLDLLIQCAIDNKKYEIQTMLIDYKYKHNLFQKKELELL